ncbi:TetR/AcrR family transcriptional regulator [Palleronia sp. LCG004]|uniref:TetR/AcrR family transcriptional regulator n=1 Tax=Palleronia sp. LCG004 TaxID=3079304 RepID=UPI002942B7D3|nr:TetR/AcrR family transcriptional regulator [Palleronia sp. LCG004]WOI57637.1 TetR/AcrR family transcriptional regulator [Palleronia sp. LCG004]
MENGQSHETGGKSAGWRGSREVWLDAARAAFLESGLDAVKIQTLAARLDLSRTSFYWFFKDRNAILDALFDDWQARNTETLVAACDAYADTIAEGVLNVLSVFVDDDGFEPRYELAIRGWAHRSDAIMARVAEADARRLAALARLFERFDVPPDEADVRARTVYLAQIGYISMQVRESVPTRIARFPAYVKTFAGVTPSARELARFHARHGIGTAAE